MTLHRLAELFPSTGVSKLVKGPGSDERGICFRCGHLYVDEGNLYICFSDDWKVSRRKPGQFFPDGCMKRQALKLLKGIIAPKLKLNGETEFIAEITAEPSRKIVRTLIDVLQMRDSKGPEKGMFSRINRKGVK